MRFGINTWGLKFPVGAEDIGAFLDLADQLGLPGEHPVIEVFASPDAADLPGARRIGEQAAARGYGVVACGFNPYMLGPDSPAPHLISDDAAERRAALARAIGFVEYAAAAAAPGEAGVISGPWHVRHKHFTGSGLTSAERDRLMDGLRAISARASDLGVRAGFEVLNRFETYVMNTVAEALDVIREVGSPHLGINWDSSHASFDEPAGVVASLRVAAQSGHLFHVHLSENHRGEYGTGPIGPLTGDMLAVLRQHRYGGAVVPELFCELLDPAVHKWIRREGAPMDAAKRAVQYLARYV